MEAAGAALHARRAGEVRAPRLDREPRRGHRWRLTPRPAMSPQRGRARRPGGCGIRSSTRCRVERITLTAVRTASGRASRSLRWRLPPPRGRARRRRKPPGTRPFRPPPQGPPGSVRAIHRSDIRSRLSMRISNPQRWHPTAVPRGGIRISTPASRRISSQATRRSLMAGRAACGSTTSAPSPTARSPRASPGSRFRRQDGPLFRMAQDPRRGRGRRDTVPHRRDSPGASWRTTSCRAKR